ncbi:kinesin light chain [Nemania sp. FL0916]|nr:kinesin light chain [Nemania sp. FL0916]
MRLLTRKGGSLLSLTDIPPGAAIPPYAILSHTWGPEEVTYEDIARKTYRGKRGYQKIDFCCKQAAKDGLSHVWVDTCCIDKSSSAELTESINSMFRWYGEAIKCYVYLEDVSDPAPHEHDPSGHQRWGRQFQESRYFTRGWTLQELIAPKTVEFFERGGGKLGTKESLQRLISDITGIPAEALRGRPLHHFAVKEKRAWARTRETTRPEDLAYSLLGIFGVQMPSIYGEGKDNALRRLEEEVIKRQKGSQHEEFSVPFSLYGAPEIEHFVGPEQELAEIHEILKSDGSRRVAVLRGLGGIGKTQLAIEYAKNHRDDYSAVFWLNIKDKESLEQSFATIAKRIQQHHPAASHVSNINIGSSNIDEIIDASKAWLDIPNNTRWLLIYDNYDNPVSSNHVDPAAIDIVKYLPEAYQGSIVITTRSSEVTIGHIVQMLKLPELEDSLTILSTTSNRQCSIDDPHAVNLARELDGFPLALATAGAYLEQTSTTFESYLRLYKDSWARLQSASPELGSYKDRTMYSTWQLTLDQIRKINPYSAELLRLWAYFDSQDIWLELLQYKDEDTPEWICEVTKDEIAFNDTVRTLSHFGLVEICPSTEQHIESRGYSVHSCVHSWMKYVLNPEWSEGWERFAIKCVASRISDESAMYSWSTERRLLQHADLYSNAILSKILDDDLSWVWFNLGMLYYRQKKLERAEEMYQGALRGYEKALGPDHRVTLHTINNLGVLYDNQGKLKKAEDMYQRALQSSKKSLGPDHLDTLDIVHNFGVLYKNKGELEKAEDMYQCALRGRKKVYGLDHPDTQLVLRNMERLQRSKALLRQGESLEGN